MTEEQISHRNFRRILVRAIVLPLVLMLALGGVLLWQINRLLDASRWVEHTDEVIAEANHAEKLLVDMETGRRGYLLTGQTEFLEPYDKASANFHPSFAHLRQLVSDNPAQQQQLDGINAIYGSWAQYGRELIELKRTGGDYVARTKSGEGKQQMDAMRAQFAAFIQTEEALRSERNMSARNASRTALIMMVALAVLLGGLFAYLANRWLRSVSKSYGRALQAERDQGESWRSSEERYRTVTETASDAILTINEASEILFVNSAAEKIFGHRRSEMLGAQITMLMPDYLRHLHEAGLKNYVETGHKHIAWESVELPGLHKSGKEIPLEISFSESFRRNERSFTGIVRDISRRKEAENVLARRARQAALAAEIGAALSERDAPLPRVLQRCAEAIVRQLDAAFARIWTLDEAENVLELRASAGMYTHLDGAHGRVPVGKFKIGLIAEERKPHLTNEVVGDARVGDQEWAMREGMVSFAGYPLIVEDRLVGVMAMFARQPLPDDTLEALASIASSIAQGIERKRAEEGLEASEQRYSYLTDAMPQLVWATDAKGSHFFYNQRWYEFTGLTEEESLGFGFANALHPEDKERTLLRWQRAWRDGESYEIEYRFYSRPQEQYRWFLGRAVPVRNDSGEIIQWVGTCTDIEEQKRMEEQLAAYARERAERLEEVLTPVVPVWRDVLALPIIGSLDTERMQRATEAALSSVMHTGARACIIDITGARIIDSHAVANLSSLMTALKLIGAEAIVTGVTAHAAQTLVGLGLDLSGMRSHRTFAEALASLIKNGQNNHQGSN